MISSKYASQNMTKICYTYYDHSLVGYTQSSHHLQLKKCGTPDPISEANF